MMGKRPGHLLNPRFYVRQVVKEQQKLGGGFKYFLCSPRNLGKMNPF